MEKVEYDFMVTEDTYRECTDLEKILEKRYFYGKGGLNVTFDSNVFISKEEGDKIANQIRLLDINKSLGQEPNPLEIIALGLLANSYGL